jgi:N-acetylglutamate synthase-like GNAT family acetyltransferase
MGKRESPKKTGISEITGKVINIRHAIVNDMYFIENILQKHHFDITDLDYRQFVVALEDTKPIGIGRLKKTGRICEIGCVLLIEEQKRRGIADIIVKHLIDYASAKVVYALTDQVNYFKKMGFKEIKEGAEAIIKKLDSGCKPLRKKQILMFLRKT